MSLKFSCPNCGSSIVVKYLKTGETCLCRGCGHECLVPTDAAPSTEEPTLGAPSLPTTVAHLEAKQDSYLAGRWTRLLARCIDNVLFFAGFMIVFFPLMLIPDFLEFHPEAILFGCGGLLAVLIYQTYLLTVAGQTLGKKMCGVRIVHHRSGRNCGFVRNVLLREVLNGILELIPGYGLADVIIIFGNERRCLHDYIAGTKVVRTDAVEAAPDIEHDERP